MSLIEMIRDETGELVPVFEERPDPLMMEDLPTFRMLDMDAINNLPEPEWLVNNMVPANSMTTLFGAPGAAKSFLALDLALSIASGHPFHGMGVKTGRVVYSLGEGIRGLRYRIEAWLLANPTADQDKLRLNFQVIPKAVHLLDAAEATTLINTINGVGDVSLLIIDTLARALVGGDENSAGDIGRAVAVCDRVRDVSNAATLIVHHMDAAGTKARGSTALPGASDAMIKMVKDDIQHVIAVSCTKMKDGEPFKPIHFNLEGFGHSAALRRKETPATSGERFRGRSEQFGGYNRSKDNPF